MHIHTHPTCTLYPDTPVHGRTTNRRTHAEIHAHANDHVHELATLQRLSVYFIVGNIVLDAIFYNDVYTERY